MSVSLRQQAEAITASANQLNIGLLYRDTPHANWRGVLGICQKVVRGELPISDLKPASMLVERLYNAIPSN